MIAQSDILALLRNIGEPTNAITLTVKGVRYQVTGANAALGETQLTVEPVPATPPCCEDNP